MSSVLPIRLCIIKLLQQLGTVRMLRAVLMIDQSCKQYGGSGVYLPQCHTASAEGHQ